MSGVISRHCHCRHFYMNPTCSSSKFLASVGVVNMQAAAAKKMRHHGNFRVANASQGCENPQRNKAGYYIEGQWWASCSPVILRAKTWH